ncbi:hypothetical protein PFFCH_00561 [Plasmodium falciparum FCH/4]|uniref:Surface antigen n=1 Tax=Plasmodium falciparum FCH/4 TaxID=1036724 RepID=A0A024VVU2_PLAFA|nr:hypothetical protein PFFCH_00561 [Plasmodium falciparum FCH/4]
MKVHYFNILLFSLPLNIILLSSQVYNQRNHILTLHKSTTTSRLLCECELYAPSNYDNDPEMKSVMQDFDRQTSQRFEEYNERMIKNREKYKELCNKDIQKIIIKDKIEKELTEKLSTLQTKIETNDILTCVCEKSVADKVEKNCLKCTQNLGKIVAPSSGVLAGISEAALYAWKPKALAAAIESALELNADKIAAAVIKACQVAGKNALIEGLNALEIEKLGIGPWEPLINPVDYTKVSGITNIIVKKKTQLCGLTKVLGDSTCEGIEFRIGTSVNIVPRPPPDKDAIGQTINGIVGQAEGPAKAAADAARQTVTAEITEKETAAINTIFMSKQTAIIASVVAIVVIVLIMIIIYLILRYRRKKKMKKKLQYIKLLEE